MEPQAPTKRPRQSGGSVPVESAPPRAAPQEESEEEMLQRALAASLEDTGRPSVSEEAPPTSAKGKEKVGTFLAVLPAILFRGLLLETHR